MRAEFVLLMKADDRFEVLRPRLPDLQSAHAATRDSIGRRVFVEAKPGKVSIRSIQA